MAIGAVTGVELVQIDLRHRVDHEPREMVLMQPLAQRRRHQKDLLTVTSDEVLGHDASSSPARTDAGFVRQPPSLALVARSTWETLASRRVGRY